MTMKRATALSLCLIFAGGFAWTKDRQGHTDSVSTIRIGNTASISGPTSAYGVIATAESAYFAMINDQGGVGGRKIDFIVRDDAYNSTKTLEQTRKLVEEDHVVFLAGSLGTPTNTMVQDYLNENKVPQLFVASGADKWNDPIHHPWTMGWQPSYRAEARIYAGYILKNVPDAKIAVLYQNDGFGRDYLAGLRQGLGDKAQNLIVATQSYETNQATVDAQIAALQASGANVLLTAAIPKFAAQAIRKLDNLGWKPTHFVSNVSVSVGSVMSVAGSEGAKGIISAGYLKEPTDPVWHNTPEYLQWRAWMKKYNASADISDVSNVYGYSVAQTIVALLKASGDNLSRQNVMKRAANIRDLKLPMLLPGITLSTSANDFAPIKQLRLVKFDGTTWQPLGNIVSASND